MDACCIVFSCAPWLLLECFCLHPHRVALTGIIDKWIITVTSAQMLRVACRALVGEGHVDALRVYGPEQTSAIVTLKASAPGGARQCKVSRPGCCCCCKLCCYVPVVHERRITCYSAATAQGHQGGWITFSVHVPARPGSTAAAAAAAAACRWCLRLIPTWLSTCCCTA
jgi:hypothetical protein